MNRAEILFLYDVSWTNPNGDPVDENKPRIDEETGKNIVTDVRLKRTIRDYLHDYKNQEIFIREISDEKGDIQDAKQRAEDFLLDENKKKMDKKSIDFQKMKTIIENNLLSDCIDVKLFGATIPIEKTEKEKGSLTYTGPVQFQMGVSLNKVKMEYIKGTGAFAAGKEKTQKTFREEYVLPYSLIGFYGIINENAAKYTKLTDDDVNLLMEAIWNGTKNLISRSKIGQQPRLLLKITYKESNYHIGEINKFVGIDFNEGMNDYSIRNTSDYKINLSILKEKLIQNKDKIAAIEYISDSSVKFEPSLDSVLNSLGNIKITKFNY